LAVELEQYWNISPTLLLPSPPLISFPSRPLADYCYRWLLVVCFPSTTMSFFLLFPLCLYCRSNFPNYYLIDKSYREYIKWDSWNCFYWSISFFWFISYFFHRHSVLIFSSHFLSCALCPSSYDPINARAALVKVHVLILFLLGVVVLASIVLDFLFIYLVGGLSKVRGILSFNISNIKIVVLVFSCFQWYNSVSLLIRSEWFCIVKKCNSRICY